MSAPYYSFWLVPQEPDLAYFQDLINTLAERFGTVPFCPHVTLYSGPWPSSVDVEQVCTKLSLTGPLELDVVNLDHDSRFAKTLYVQLRQIPALAQLVNHLVTAIPEAKLPILDPHLSLLYHRLDAATQQALTATITLPQPTIKFNQIHAVAAPSNFETQEHVVSLRRVHSQWLTMS